mgnify:CR=1 FL=1
MHRLDLAKNSARPPTVCTNLPSQIPLVTQISRYIVQFLTGLQGQAAALPVFQTQHLQFVRRVVGGGGFGPPPSIIQQQKRSEGMAKMMQAQDAILRRNLNEQEYAVVSKARTEMQSQKRVTVYTVNGKGELESHMLMVGLSDGSNVQIVRGAKEGEKYVVRATSNDKGGAKP